MNPRGSSLSVSTCDKIKVALSLCVMLRLALLHSRRHMHPASHTQVQCTPTKDGRTILNKHYLSPMARDDPPLNSLNPFTRRLISLEACSRSVRKILRGRRPPLRRLIIRGLRYTMCLFPALSVPVTIKVGDLPLSNACCSRCEVTFTC